jgi:hypothetical protein
VTEEHPGADQPPASDAEWAEQMFGALGYNALPRISDDRAAAFEALHQWLDSWRGIGDLERGMHRQGFALHLVREADEGWRATFFGRGKVHSLPAATGTAWEKTPWLAVQRAAARTLDKTERAEMERDKWPIAARPTVPATPSRDNTHTEDLRMSVGRATKIAAGILFILAVIGVPIPVALVPLGLAVWVLGEAA